MYFIAWILQNLFLFHIDYSFYRYVTWILLTDFILHIWYIRIIKFHQVLQTLCFYKLTNMHIFNDIRLRTVLPICKKIYLYMHFISYTRLKNFFLWKIVLGLDNSRWCRSFLSHSVYWRFIFLKYSTVLTVTYCIK